MSKSEALVEKPAQAWRLNQLIKDYIERLGQTWVERETTQVNSKLSWKLSYVTLRDTSAEFSMSVTCSTATLRNSPLRNGDHVVALDKPAFYAGRGQFSLRATEWRLMGLGQLLARLEQLRQTLAAEGLSDPRLKHPLSYLPDKIRLITDHSPATERGVLSATGARQPEVNFRVINTIMQGTKAVPEITEVLAQLNADPEVDVIIVAHNGGSVEGLPPFSGEVLIHVVSKATTPMISVIGHGPGILLLGYIADLRAAAPTDAAKKAVPDTAEERRLIAQFRERPLTSLRRWANREVATLRDLTSRPVLRDPLTSTRVCEELVTAQADRLRSPIHRSLEREEAVVPGSRGEVSALDPFTTLAHGYAVVQTQPATQPEPQIVTSTVDAPMSSQLQIRASDGFISAAMPVTKPANQ